MSEQAAGKLSEGELEAYRCKYRSYCKTIQRSDFGETLRKLLGHIAYQAAKIERLTKELSEATAKLDALKVDPAKREEFGERAADIFDHAFKTPEYLAKGGGEWISCQPQRREAWIKVAEFFFAAGRASAPEIAELTEKLEAAEGGEGGEYEYECFYCGAEWSSPDAAEGHRLALAHNAECPDNPSRQVEADRDRLAEQLKNRDREWAAALFYDPDTMVSQAFGTPEGAARWREAHLDSERESIEYWGKLRSRAAKKIREIRADRDRLAAELATEKQNHQATAELLGVVSKDAKDKDAELGEAKQALATLTNERDRDRVALRQVDAGRKALREKLEKACQPLMQVLRKRRSRSKPDPAECAGLAEHNRIFYGDLIAIEAALAPPPEAKPSEPMPEPLTAAEFAELGEVLDAEASAEKVGPPASEARRFVCPKCESSNITCQETTPIRKHCRDCDHRWTEMRRLVVCPKCGKRNTLWYSLNPSHELYCRSEKCDWKGSVADSETKAAKVEAAIQIPSTAEQLGSVGGGQPQGLKSEPEEHPFAEVEAAKGPTPSAENSSAFRCPKCNSKYFRTIRIKEGLPQLLQCKGHWNGDVIGEKYKGCSWQGTWDEVRGHGLRQQLTASKRQREGLIEVIRNFDVLPCVNDATRWPEPPKMDDRWSNAVCGAADRVKAGILDAVAKQAGDEATHGEHDRWSAGFYNGLPLGNLMTFRAGDRTFQERIADWFGSNKRTGEQHKYYHGVFPLGMVGGWIDRAALAERQLAAERQAREAADRRATEKILELERRCNDEHHKCEAAEQRAEQAETAKQDEVYLRGNQLAAISTVLMANTPVTLSQVRLPKDRSLYTAAFRDAVNAVEREIKERQRAEQAEEAAGAMKDAIRSRLIEVEEMVARGKGTWPEKNYVRDDVWARWQGELLVLRSLNNKALASDAGRAAANELRALRTFRAEIEQDYQAWANATIGEAELRIRLGVARNKVDKALAGQGAAGKDGR